MERYTCEFEVWHGERYWVAAPLGMEGATQGLTKEDAWGGPVGEEMW